MHLPSLKHLVSSVLALSSLLATSDVASAQYRFFVDAVSVAQNHAITLDGIVWTAPPDIGSELGGCPGNCGAQCAGFLDHWFTNALPAQVGYSGFKVCGGYRHWEVVSNGGPTKTGGYEFESCAPNDSVILNEVEFFEMEATWAFHGLYTFGCEVHDFINRNPQDHWWAERTLNAGLPDYRNPVWLNVACTEHVAAGDALPQPYTGFADGLTRGWQGTKQRITDLAREWNRPSGQRVWGPTSPRRMVGWRVREIERRPEQACSVR